MAISTSVEEYRNGNTFGACSDVRNTYSGTAAADQLNSPCGLVIDGREIPRHRDSH
jgi:hypothetical protein